MKNLLQQQSITTFLFLLAVFLPVSDMWLTLDRSKQLNEHRQLAKPPQLRFSGEFPSAYTQYFNDHFGFRNSLVRANFIIRYYCLGISPSSNVILGKSGWLFHDEDIEYYRGITKYDAATLDEWARILEMKRFWLEQRGIRYLFVVAPNKSSIYGEFLPDSYNRVRERTALDDLIDCLSRHTKVEVVDLRQALLAAKTKARLYYKTDTHWNEYGAFIAYRQIMKPIVRWFPSLKIQTVDDYRLEINIRGGGDLAGMMGGAEFIKDDYIMLRPLNNHSLQIEDIDIATKSPVTFKQNDLSLPRALVFRDSFFSSVAPLFARHFQYSGYYWQRVKTSTPIDEIVSSQKPDIVIDENVERYVKNAVDDSVKSPPKFIADMQIDKAKGEAAKELTLKNKQAGNPTIKQ